MVAKALLVVNSNLPSCTVSKLWPIIDQIFAIDMVVPHFNVPAGGDPCEYPDIHYLSRK